MKLCLSKFKPNHFKSDGLPKHEVNAIWLFLFLSARVPQIANFRLFEIALETPVSHSNLSNSLLKPS